jgi:hypothetical protein
VVGARGATLRASNGQLTLALPAGTFAGATRVTVREAGGPEASSYVPVTGAYEFRATAPLGAPANLTMRYRVPVTHFQVAAGLARAIDWMCWDGATAKWVAVPTTVDTAAGTFTAAMPHFSYWIGAVKDPHGTTKTDYCGDQTVCHALVEAPGSQIVLSSADSQVCYNCHGNSSAALAAAGSKGHNIQAEFFACSGQSQPTSMSAHPVRAPGSTSGLKCTQCHDPHADKASSPRLLRAFSTTGVAIAGGKGSPPPAAAYCAGCHGVSRNRNVDAQHLNYWADSGGGRIDFSRFAGSVHEAAMKPADAVYGCTGCHKPHASGDNPMLMPAGAIDWTEWGASQQQQSRATCYGCHSGSTRRTWNNRDVKVEFARASHHPIVAETPDALPATSTVTVLEQSSRAEFASLGLAAFSGAAVEDLVDAVRLGDDTWPEAYPTSRLLLLAGDYSHVVNHSATNHVVNQMDPATGLWNTTGNWNPPDQPRGATGDVGGSFVASGTLYALDAVTGPSDIRLRSYPLPARGADEVWTDGISAPSLQVQASVDASHDLVYVINDGSSGVDTMRISDGTLTSSQFSMPYAIGYGSASAYAPQADKLFFINRNMRNGGDGRLYSVSSPSSLSGQVPASDTGLFVNDIYIYAGGYDADMVVGNVGGTEYLFLMCSIGNRWRVQVVGDLASATQTQTITAKQPWPDEYSSLYNADIAWDGGGYLYAVCDRWPWAGVIKRIAIPSNPMDEASWGEWADVSTAPAWGRMHFADVRPPDFMDSGYKSVGTVAAPLTAPDGAISWGRVEWTASTPTSTSVSVTLQRASGTGWVDVAGYTNMSGGSADLSGMSAVTYPRLRLLARLATENKHATPQLLSWRATALKGRPVHRAPTLVPKGVYNTLMPTATVDTSKAFDASLTVATLPETTTYTPVPDRRLMYMTDTSTGEVLQYDVADNAWNTYGLDPNNYTKDANVRPTSVSFAQDGYAFTTRPWGGTLSYLVPTAIPYLSQQAGWNKAPVKTGTPLAQDSLGSDAAVDSANKIAYVSRGTAQNGVIDMYYMWNGTLNGGGSILPYDNSTLASLNLGDCSSMAYVPPPVDRLYFIDKNTSTGSGKLYWIASPLLYYNNSMGFGDIMGAAAQNTGIVLSASTNRVHMTRVNKGGTEYLVAICDDLGARLAVISNLGATVPTFTWKDFTNIWVGPGMQLEWDGADYVYFQQGNQGLGFYRSAIPANPVTDSWVRGTWTALPAPPRTVTVTNTMYSSIAFTMSPVRGIPVQQYSSTGTTYSPAVSPTSGATQWGLVRWTGTDEAGVTTVSVTVQGSAQTSGDTTWEDLAGFIGRRDRVIDLAGLSTTAYKRLRLKGILETSAVTKTPRLERWGVWCGSGSGRWRSPAILSEVSDTSWGVASLAANQPFGSSMTVTVETSLDGTNFAPELGFINLPLGAVQLSSLSTLAHPYIRLVVDYAPATGQVLGALQQVAVTCVHVEDRPTGAMTCASCHNVHNVAGALTGAWDPGRVSDPQNTRARSLDVTSTVSGFCLRCHTTRIVRKAATASSLVLWDVLFSEQSSDRWFFTGFDKDTPGFSPYQSAHFTTTGTRAYCETCHDPHGSDNEHLTAWTRPASWTTGTPGVRDNSNSAAFEERLCLQCHGNGAVGKQAPGAPDVATPLGGSNVHPVRSVGAVHSDSETTASLGVPSRHAECVDCHDPHTAREGVHQVGSATAGGALYGAIGVQPIWGTEQWTPAIGYEPHRLQDTARDPEAYLCFKCHTDVTSRPTTGTSGTAYSDLTVAFNPNNMSYHNVLGLTGGAKTSFSDGVSTYTWPWRGAFKPGWTKESGVTCTGCHTSEAVGSARGPHGSSTNYMLDSNYSMDFRNATFTTTHPMTTTPANLICNKCHDFANSGNTAHHPSVNTYNSMIAHGSVKCSSCHIAIPHGWKRPRLLAYATDPAPYTAGIAGGGTLKKVAKNGGARWDIGDCETNCGHVVVQGEHDATMTVPYWP